MNQNFDQYRPSESDSKKLPDENSAFQDKINQQKWLEKIENSEDFDSIFVSELPQNMHTKYALHLIDSGLGSELARHLDQFNIPDPTTIIEKMYEKGLILHLACFAKEIDPVFHHLVVDKLLAANKINYLLKIADDLSGCDINYIANQILESDKNNEGIMYITHVLNADQMQKLSHQLIVKINDYIAGLIDGIDKYFLVTNLLQKMPWLSDSVAIKISRHTSLNIFNLEYYPKFKNLGIESLQVIMQEREPHEIMLHLSKFDKKAVKYLETEYSLLSCHQDTGVVYGEVLKDYHNLRKQNDPILLQGFIDDINQKKEKFTSPSKQDPNIIDEKYYQDIIKALYPQNSQYSSFKSNESCPDRTADLSIFSIRDNYPIKLMPGNKMVVKENVKLDKNKLSTLEYQIKHPVSEITKFNSDEKLTLFSHKIDSIFNKFNISQDKLCTNEDKILVLLLEAQLNPDITTSEIKQIIIEYQIAHFPVIEEYLQGTRDRVNQSTSPEYFYLLEIREFFTDKIKDTQREIVTKALENKVFEKILTHFYQKISGQEQEILMQDKINKMQIDKIGGVHVLVKIENVLKNKKTKLFKTNETKEIILDQKGKAIAGIISNEQNKAAKALEILKKEKIDPASIHLGELNLTEYLDLEKNIGNKSYDQHLFANYLTQLFHDIFLEEINFIDQEIAKFQPIETTSDRVTQLKKLDCYITKNHTSAHTRSVGGVCVSGDNPLSYEGNEKRPENMWEMSNYFQMALHDSQTKNCQGLVLLHYYEENSQKILTASLNPCSTFLFKIDEKLLFDELIKQLSIFATDNGIDKILTSENPQIRTNRTGGAFEEALKERIALINEKYIFPEPKRFSYFNNYHQQNMDVIWMNNYENKNFNI